MPEHSPPIDLRSDTVTRPSADMRKAIAEAEVGDAVLGDDPTVAEFENFAAEILGKERALFFPSGIMANQTAIMLHAPPGTEAIIDAGGHILNWEESAAAAWGGVQLRAVQTMDGLLSAADVAGAIRPRSLHLPQTALICLENTHNSAGGRILSLAQLAEVSSVARENDVPVHLDGARLPNAVAATGIPFAQWAEHADTVMVALSKGLGAPVGSILAGTDLLMERAWRIRRRLGGGMRQAGILAAAGLFALRHNLSRLDQDHQNARTLADGARQIDGFHADVPDTNIVMIDIIDDSIHAEPLLARLHARGVWMTQFGPRRLRAVTHLDVDSEGIRRSIVALEETVGALAGT
ncbi:MAG TPA: GntG family PLP-dependent aldolase [Longimicrobiaceae bacterium]|nr:GntG family PLP-dependent aldolase [Longimicrobiaceae bacterium]